MVDGRGLSRRATRRRSGSSRDVDLRFMAATAALQSALDIVSDVTGAASFCSSAAEGPVLCEVACGNVMLILRREHALA